MKILISDFDGTMFDSDFNKNIDLVNNFVSSGNIFILASGRSLYDLKKVIDNYHIKIDYYICNDGATIYDEFCNIIYRKDIENSAASKIMKTLKEETSEFYIDTTNGLTSDIDRSVNRIIVRYKDKKKANELLNKLKKEIPNINGYLSTNWINITNKSVSKGNAIEYLINFYNLDSNNIITMGNDVNDISMTRFNSVAIKSGDEKYIKMCDMVIDKFADIFKKMRI